MDNPYPTLTQQNVGEHVMHSLNGVLVYPRCFNLVQTNPITFSVGILSHNEAKTVDAVLRCLHYKIDCPLIRNLNHTGTDTYSIDNKCSNHWMVIYFT